MSGDVPEHLRKYIGDDDGHKKKRRKKGSKNGQGSDVASKSKSGLLIIDDEADMAKPDRKKVDKAWEDEEAEEEKPVMVLNDPQDEKVSGKGSWTTVGGNDHHTRPNTYITDDASPPRRRKLYDWADNDASPPRRNPNHGADKNSRAGAREDASPPRRRKRHASVASDASPPPRILSGVRHGNSRAEGSDTSPPRRNRGGEGRGGGKSRDDDASPPRKPIRPGGFDDSTDTARSSGRERNDRDSERRGGRGGERYDASPRRRRRHDSSDDDNSPPRRKSSHGGRNGRSRSPGTEAVRDASPPRRRKNAEREAAAIAEADSDPSPPRRQNRESNGRGERSRGDRESSRRRHDSPERGSRNGSSAKGKDDDRESGRGREDKRAKTATGYYAGLQSGKDFKVVEQELKRKHDAEMKGADAAASGQGATTIYRDKKGRKLDMLNEFMRQQNAREGKEVAEKEAQFEWGRGKVQKEQDKEWQEEIENIAAEPFARTIDDARLEDARKAEIRPDDPMAAYIAKKQVKKQKLKGGVPAKPEYKGPPPKPNRFNIRPGYRWDGVDRGNGWEDKIVAKAVDSRYKADLAYQWATADM